jgi:hypothetical protein
LPMRLPRMRPDLPFSRCRYQRPGKQINSPRDRAP